MIDRPGHTVRPIAAPGVVLVVTTGAACVGAIALAVRWAADPAPIVGISSPGVVVTAGLPLIQGAGLVVGSIVLAMLITVLLSEADDTHSQLSRAARRWCRAAAAGTGTLAVVLVARMIWTVADIAGTDVATAVSNARRLSLWSVPTVRVLILMVGVTVVATVLLVRVRQLPVVGVTAVLVGLVLVLPSITGHATTAAAHGWLLLASPLHAGASIVWLAVVVAVLVGLRTPRTVAEIRRGTRALTWAVGGLVASGVILALAQLSAPSDLWATDYGRVVSLKITVLVAAGAAGLVARSRLAHCANGEAERGRVAAVVAAEALVLACAMVLGSILTSSPAPRPPAIFTTAGERLAGFAFPPPPTLETVALSIAVDPVFLAIAVSLAGLYTLGVARLMRRGDRWPWGRTISWALGVLAFAWLTNSGLGQYANIAPGMHMGQHMGLTMLVPVLLVLGAPATLALRALRPSTERRWGPREWLVVALHSRVLAMLTNPVVVLAIYFSGLYGLYLSNAFSTLMSSHPGHVLMQVHFVVSGYLFYWILIGIDPRPRALPYWARFFILIIASAFHGFFAVAMMMSAEPLAPAWFAVVQPPWVEDLLQDTISGGQIAWAIGEFPLAIVAIALAVQWARSDERDARRNDRKADRDGDRDLVDYNAYLAALNRRPERAPSSADP